MKGATLDVCLRVLHGRRRRLCHSLPVHELVLDSIAGDDLATLVPGDRWRWSAIHFADQLHRSIGTSLNQQLFDGGRLSCEARERERVWEESIRAQLH